MPVTPQMIAGAFRHPLGNGLSTPVHDGDGFYVFFGFDQPNSAINNSHHLGADWNGEGGGNSDLGEPVHAIGNGEILAKVSDQGASTVGFGNYVVIRHHLAQPIVQNGLTVSYVNSLYAHLNSVEGLTVGQSVAMGQQIGTLGKSGKTDGVAHLHFEITLGNTLPTSDDAYNPAGAPAAWVDPVAFVERSVTEIEPSACVTMTFSGTVTNVNSVGVAVPGDVRAGDIVTGSFSYFPTEAIGGPGGYYFPGEAYTSGVTYTINGQTWQTGSDTYVGITDNEEFYGWPNLRDIFFVGNAGGSRTEDKFAKFPGLISDGGDHGITFSVFEENFWEVPTGATTPNLVSSLNLPTSSRDFDINVVEGTMYARGEVFSSNGMLDFGDAEYRISFDLDPSSFRFDFADGDDTVPWGTATTFALAAGSPVNGVINATGLNGPNPAIDRDWYRVTLQGGHSYSLTGSADALLTDPLDAIAMRLYADLTTPVTPLADAANPTLPFNVPGTGPVSYWLAVSAGGMGDWAAKTGAYTLNVTETGTAPPVNHRPVATTESQTAASGTAIPLADLFTFRDPDGAGDISRFTVQDRTAGNGYLTLDGVAQAANQVLEGQIADLHRWAFVAENGPDQIGFNAIDRAGAFNTTVIATVSPAAAVPHLDSAAELFAEADGKLTTMALFAHAAYQANDASLEVLEDLGWKIFEGASDRPGFVGSYYENRSPVNIFDGTAGAVVAESEDGNSLVIAFRGTDTGTDWVNNFTGITRHYALFDGLWSQLDFSQYDHIYVTGHSLGAAMAQSLMLDPRFRFTSDLRVETTAFANPGYLINPLQVWQPRVVNIAIEGDPVAEIGMGVRTVGDTYKLDHTLSLDTDWHVMGWYLAAARYLDSTAFAATIEDQQRDRSRDRQDVNVRLEMRDGQEWVGHLGRGTTVSPDEVQRPVTFGLDLPSDQWAMSVDTGMAASTPRVIFDAPQHTNTEFEVSQTPLGEVVIRDSVGTVLFLAWEYNTLKVAAGIAGTTVKIGSLALTHILNNTVYFEGNTGDDGVDGAEADRRIVATGGNGDDRFTGGSSGDRLSGDAGNDSLDGGLGDDTVSGGGGNDSLSGLAGNDWLCGDDFRPVHALDAARQVYRLYQATLDRDPDTAGLTDWTARINDGGITSMELAGGFVGSREFQNVYGALNDQAFVTLLYGNVLDRDPDTAGIAYWTGRLAAGTSREQVVLGFSDSLEFVRTTQATANAFIQARSEAGWTDDIYRLYQATLGREPDPGGFLDWTGRLANGQSFLSSVAGFTGSREFQRVYGPLDDAGFVSLLYRNVLDREPDALGLANWIARLAAGTSREQVVEGFSQSREFVNASATGVKEFIRGLGVNDKIEGGGGDNTMWGGHLADRFVFDASVSGQHRVMDLEPWDWLDFDGFGFSDASSIRARMVQAGADAVFSDGDVTVVLANTQVSALADDMFVF